MRLDLTAILPLTLVSLIHGNTLMSFHLLRKSSYEIADYRFWLNNVTSIVQIMFHSFFSTVGDNALLYCYKLTKNIYLQEINQRHDLRKRPSSASTYAAIT